MAAPETADEDEAVSAEPEPVNTFLFLRNKNRQAEPEAAPAMAEPDGSGRTGVAGGGTGVVSLGQPPTPHVACVWKRACRHVRTTIQRAHAAFCAAGPRPAQPPGILVLGSVDCDGSPSALQARVSHSLPAF